MTGKLQQSKHVQYNRSPLMDYTIRTTREVSP